MDRRAFAAGGVGSVVALAATPERARAASDTAYGLISQILVAAENRDALATLLLDASKNMPGCLSYVVGLDLTRNDSLWVTELWQDSASHAASLALPNVQAAVAKGRILMRGLGVRVEIKPIL